MVWNGEKALIHAKKNSTLAYGTQDTNCGGLCATDHGVRLTLH
jgi:hypothetical protein